MPLEKPYVQAVTEYCQARDILVIVDEVQTGIGRTGTLFACEQYGIKPDIITCAKGLGAGLPIGARAVWRKGAGRAGASAITGSTFGANPVACAGAGGGAGAPRRRDAGERAREGRLHHRRS